MLGPRSGVDAPQRATNRKSQNNAKGSLDLNMENLNGDRNTAVPMITKDVEKVSTPAPGVGKVLIREDTVLTVPGCTSCGRGQFTCSGVQKQWSALCWGQQSDKKYYTRKSLF